MRGSGWTVDDLGRVVCFGSILQHLIHGFPLSGPESGHTERRAARNAAVATVLFHPDFNRRLRNCTESADPSSLGTKALAGLGLSTLTAGGDFHPALRTSAARDERPDRNMTPLRGHSKPVPHGKTAWTHADMDIHQAGRASRDGINDWRAGRESDSGLFSN